jgi:hypothetical protein
MGPANTSPRDGNDRSGNRDPGCRRGIGDRVKQNGAHVGSVTVIVFLVVDVAHENQRPDDHHRGCRAADNRNRQSVDLVGPAGKAAQRLEDDERYDNEKEHSVCERGDCGGLWVAVRPARGRSPTAQRNGEQTHSDGARVGEIITTRCEYPQ